MENRLVGTRGWGPGRESGRQVGVVITESHMGPLGCWDPLRLNRWLWIHVLTCAIKVYTTKYTHTYTNEYKQSWRNRNKIGGLYRFH